MPQQYKSGDDVTHLFKTDEFKSGDDVTHLFNTEPETEKPKEVNEDEPGNFAGGFAKSVLSGDALNAGLESAGGYLKGATLDIPRTLYEGAKNAVTHPFDTMLSSMGPLGDVLSGRDSMSGIRQMSESAGAEPEQFGRMLGQQFGQPAITAGLIKGAPYAKQGIGVGLENTGRIMKDYTPISTATGAAVGGAYGGFPGAVMGTMRPFTRPLRSIERMIGRGVERIGQKIRVPRLNGEIVPPEEMPFQDIEIIDTTKKLPPSNIRFYHPESFEGGNTSNNMRQQKLLTEGQELPKPKMRVMMNRDGTFTNTETGEMFDSRGNPLETLMDRNSPIFKKNQNSQLVTEDEMFMKDWWDKSGLSDMFPPEKNITPKNKK